MEKPYCAACSHHGTSAHDPDCLDFVTVTVPRNGGDYLIRTDDPESLGQTEVYVAVYQDGLWYAGSPVT